MLDLLIKNCIHPRLGKKVDIGIREGKIAKIGSVDEESELVVEAAGCLVLESFVIPHLHLCKAYTFDLVGWEAVSLYREDLMHSSSKSIGYAAQVKKHYTVDWVYSNASRAVEECRRHGVTHIRAFADVDSLAGLEAVKALLKLRDNYRGRVELQVVAFPQQGLCKDPESLELLYKAVELGCDVVGGIPWIESSEDEMERHVKHVFDIAVEFNKDVATLTDDAGDPNLKTTEMLCKETLQRGWQGRVAACHARALALYPTERIDELAALMKEAGVSLVSSPHTGTLWAPVKRLYQAGVNVALGQDDINDAYYPFGRGKMLEVAFLAAHLLNMMGPGDIEALVKMVTVNAAYAIGMKDHRISPGNPANLVILPCRTLLEALWYQPDPLYTIVNGKLYDFKRTDKNI
jgi:cytosine deaminase